MMRTLSELCIGVAGTVVLWVVIGSSPSETAAVADGGFAAVLPQIRIDGPSMDQLKRDLVVASRALFLADVLSTSGHVSVRLDADRFLMSRSRAPELIESSDVIVYSVDGSVHDPDNREPFRERYLHGEIYKSRPDVQAIVHGHTPTLVMWASSSLPLRPLMREAGFAGDEVPIFRNGNNGAEITTASFGQKLAVALGKRSAILLHGHGMVVTASTLVEAVNRSIGLMTNAEISARVLAMGDMKPSYIQVEPAVPNAANSPQSPGGDRSRQWEAYVRRAATLDQRQSPRRTEK